ncbi:MAG TPA: hypothetical protein VIF62_20255 [Labilithrix sp.]|jgi:DNA-binding IscR family transcriptional regulator
MSTRDHAIASHVLLFLAQGQARGRATRLDELAIRVGARREDVRDVVTRLHREGHVDAARMRLTMSGLALAASLRGCKLPDVRPAERDSQMNVA